MLHARQDAAAADRRHPHVDVLKGLGIVVIPLIHALPDFDEAPWVRLLNFAVPGFLASSGFLYSKDPSFRATRKRLERILCPYFCASCVLWACRLAGYIHERPVSWIGCVQDLLLGSAIGPFYFVFVIVTLTVTTPLFAVMSPAIMHVLLFTCVVGELQLSAHLMGSLWSDVTLFWLLRHPLRWWGYFLYGWLSPTWHDVTPWPLVMILVVVAMLALSAPSGQSYFAWTWAVCVLAPALFSAKFTFPGFRVLQWLSTNSYTIYLYHYPFIRFAQLHLSNPDNTLVANLLPVATWRVLQGWLFALAGGCAVAYVAPLLCGVTVSTKIFGCAPMPILTAEPSETKPLVARVNAATMP